MGQARSVLVNEKDFLSEFVISEDILRIHKPTWVEYRRSALIIILKKGNEMAETEALNYSMRLVQYGEIEMKIVNMILSWQDSEYLSPRLRILISKRLQAL